MVALRRRRRAIADHIPKDRALLLAALDHDDPERRAALDHAETCSACGKLLARATSVLSLIDAQRIDMNVDQRLKARILASIDTLEETTRWEPYALGFGALLSVVLALADRGLRVGLFPAHAWLCFAWQLLGALLSLAGVSL